MSAYIKDTGVGKKPKNIGKLFENYVQLDQKENRKVMGTGLGLPLTKKLLEMMGGTISVESEYGKGSTFSVSFTQKYVNDEVIGADVVENLKNSNYIDRKRKQDTKIKRIKLPYARVLVVDDVATNLDVARGMMKPYGMQLDFASSGQQAVDAIRDESIRYNAIFMDHMMPEMDGVEATRIIREEIGTEYAKTVPIIALTANAIAGNEEMFLSKGFQAFLSKPIEIARIDEVIRQWVRDEKLEAEQPEIVNEQTEASQVGIAPSKILSFHIDGLDLKKGLERFGGDEESYLQVLRSYAANTRSLLESVKNVTQDNLAKYVITVHGIKGSSYGIHADLAGDKAEALEHASKAGDFNFVSDNNREFADIVGRLLSDLDNMLGAIAADVAKPKKERPDENVLKRILEACKSYDMDTVDAAIAELESYEYDSDGELVAWLWENVQQFNLTEIVEKLSHLEDISRELS